jgi:hypothetical protein
MENSRWKYAVMLAALLALPVAADGLPVISRPYDRVGPFQTHLVKLGGGWDALGKVQTLSFEFVIRVPSEPDMVFDHAYDAVKGLYRYECSCADFARVPVWDETADDRWQPAPNPPEGNRLLAVYSFPRLEGTVYVDGRPLPEAENVRILRRVHSRVMNARAWMFLPLFMNSPTIRPHLLPEVGDPEFGRLKRLRVYWGEKPSDSDVYTMCVDTAGELVRTDFQLKHDLSKSTTVYWRNWEWYGPVRIARERYLPASGRQLLFQNVKVNEPVEVSALD